MSIGYLYFGKEIFFSSSEMEDVLMVAIDDGGNVYGYTNPPEISEEYGCWKDRGGMYTSVYTTSECIGEFNDDDDFSNPIKKKWRESLVYVVDLEVIHRS